jgi:hypothetical protein
MKEAWYHFARQLVDVEPTTVEPEHPALAEVWKETENLYWVWNGSCWMNFVTGELKND